MARTLITNGTIVTAEGSYRADVLVDGETIAQIGAGLAGAGVTADRTIDATGKWVIPGGIDVHTHMKLPFGGTFAKDDFYTGTRAAAFGGLCCSLPAMTSFMSGQDTPFILLWMALAAMLTRRGHRFSAGLVLSLCQTKFHLFLPLWLILIAGQHWRFLVGMVAGNGGLALAGAIGRAHV